MALQGTVSIGVREAGEDVEYTARLRTHNGDIFELGCASQNTLLKDNRICNGYLAKIDRFRCGVVGKERIHEKSREQPLVMLAFNVCNSTTNGGGRAVSAETPSTRTSTLFIEGTHGKRLVIVRSGTHTGRESRTKCKLDREMELAVQARRCFCRHSSESSQSNSDVNEIGASMQQGEELLVERGVIKRMGREDVLTRSTNDQRFFLDSSTLEKSQPFANEATGLHVVGVFEMATIDHAVDEFLGHKPHRVASDSKILSRCD
ncbi:hypothetical protein C8R43DRAFT_947773 [Mycena crocata]|nr:hypothetical protein C8R43DRAFT_947773 [Mycena crocata]